MRIKFTHDGPRLVGAKHYYAGDREDFHEALARRLIRGNVAVLDTGPPDEKAVIDEKLENPEAKRDRKK